MNIASMSTADLTALIERLEADLDSLDLEEEPRRGWREDRDAVVAQLRDAQTEHDARWAEEHYRPRLYKCDGFRSVTATDASEAASIFADRWARRLWGKRGYCHHARLDSWSESGRFHHFEAFIGTPEGNGCTGKNVWLTVYR